MARILGIDFGTKRVGFAVTDPLQIIVNPLEVRERRDALQFLTDYCSKEQVELIVCGQPAERYQETRTALLGFIAEVQKALPDMRIVYQDEELSSDRAAGIIRRSGLRKYQRRDKSLIDKVSAVLILQEYLGHLRDAYLT